MTAVIDLKVKKLEDVYDAVAEKGRLSGQREDSQKLIQAIKDELAVKENCFKGRQAKRTILLIWNQPFLTVNFDTYVSRLIEASGGMNVFRTEPIYQFPIEMEDMIEALPEVLLLTGEPGPFRSRHIKDFRRYRIFSKIPIHLLDGGLWTDYGAKTVEALRTLREIYQNIS